MTNILFVTDTEPIPTKGGVARVVYNLSRDFKNDSEFRIFTASFDNHSLRLSRTYYIESLKKIIFSYEIKMIVFNIDGSGEILNNIEQLKQFVKIVIFHHSYIHSFKQSLCEYYLLQLKEISLKKIFKLLIAPIYSFIFALFIQPKTYLNALKKCDYYLVLSEALKKDLINRLRLFRIDKNKIFAIPNGHSFNESKPALIKKEKILIYVGRIDYKSKNIFEILKIWKEIKNTDYYLYFVGGGEDFQRLQADIEKLKLKNIVLCGNTSDVANYYKKASLLILTSKEGFGLVINECREYGVIPIIYNNFSTAKDLIDNGLNGFLIKPYKRTLFIRRLKELMTLEEEKKEIIREACFFKAKNYSSDIINEKWRFFFRETIR